MNALDNAVKTELTISNMVYTANDLLKDADTFNTGFADDYVASYSTVGDVWIEKDAYSGFSLSTGGCVTTAVSQSEIEQLMGTSGSVLDEI